MKEVIRLDVGWKAGPAVINNLDITSVVCFLGMYDKGNNYTYALEGSRGVCSSIGKGEVEVKKGNPP